MSHMSHMASPLDIQHLVCVDLEFIAKYSSMPCTDSCLARKECLAESGRLVVCCWHKATAVSLPSRLAGCTGLQNAMHAGVCLDVAPNSSAQHSIAACFLAPGIYSLYAYDVHQLLDQFSVPTQRETIASAKNLIAVSPAYFIVE